MGIDSLAIWYHLKWKSPTPMGGVWRQQRGCEVRQPSSIHPAHFGLAIGAQPVRLASRRNRPGQWGGHYSSHKAIGPAPFETLLERDFQTHLTASPYIKSYAVQPHHLIYWAPDESGAMVKRRYTPDIVALGLKGEVLVFEVKAKVLAESPKWRWLEPYIRDAYRLDHGVPFRVMTDLEIRAQPWLSNCEVMLRHRGAVRDPAGELTVRELVQDQACEPTIETIVAKAERRGVDERRSYSALMRMALAGEVILDLSTPLSADSRVKLELV